VSYSFHAVAQSSFYETERNTFYGALIAGGCFSQVDGDNYSGYHKTGIQAGGAVYIFLGQNLAASMEILYTQKGSRGRGNRIDGRTVTNYSIDLNYAEVPLQLFYIDKNWNHFGLGFSYGRLVNFRENIETNPVNTIDTELYPFKKDDFNFVAGANVCLYKGLFLNVRMQYSLVPVRDELLHWLGRQGQYNNSWQFRIMYLFGK
jgi:hypothetical protein